MDPDSCIFELWTLEEQPEGADRTADVRARGVSRLAGARLGARRRTRTSRTSTGSSAGCGCPRRRAAVEPPPGVVRAPLPRGPRPLPLRRARLDEPRRPRRAVGDRARRARAARRSWRRRGVGLPLADGLRRASRLRRVRARGRRRARCGAGRRRARSRGRGSPRCPSGAGTPTAPTGSPASCAAASTAWSCASGEWSSTDRRADGPRWRSAALAMIRPWRRRTSSRRADQRGAARRVGAAQPARRSSPPRSSRSIGVTHRDRRRRPDRRSDRRSSCWVVFLVDLVVHCRLHPGYLRTGHGEVRPVGGRADLAVVPAAGVDGGQFVNVLRLARLARVRWSR